MSVQGLGIRACMRPPNREYDEGDVVRTMSSSTARNTTANPRFRHNHGRTSLSARPAPSRAPSELLSTPGALRRVRSLYPPPPFRNPDPRSSLSAFLATSALPADCLPESVDVTFKAHLALLRRLTKDPFEAHNRFLFVYKPLARANAVLAGALLSVPEADIVSSGGIGSGMSTELRAAVMYVACNSFRSVYGMAFAGQMTSVYKSGPPPEGLLSAAIINGLGLSPEENAALDFAQELSAVHPAALDSSLRLVMSGGGLGNAEPRQQLERQVAGVVSYAAFMCRLMGALDVELSYEAVKYAAGNLSHSLQWGSTGRHFNFEGIEDAANDLGAVREAPPRRRRLPHLVSSSVTMPRLLSEANRSQDGWLKGAWIPKPGKLLEMNDCIKSCFGFYPFYLSVGAVQSEALRRALLFGCKELLFGDGETSRRLKFLVCYVTSYKRGELGETGDNQRPTPRSTFCVDAPFVTPRRRLPRRGSLDMILEEEDCPPMKPSNPKQEYDPAGIITAHAAFLATRYGATAAELLAAVDEKKVREAMDRYLAQPDDDPEMTAYPVRFPLTKKDCAAVLMGHALAKSPADMSAEVLDFMERSFGVSPHAHRGRGGRTCHKAILEVISPSGPEVLGAASMWGLLERYCAGATTFNIDLSANLYFGGGPAEPAICSFACGAVGKEIGLALSRTAKVPDSVLERAMTYRNSPVPPLKENHRRSRKRSVSFLSSTGAGLRLWGRR